MPGRRAAKARLPVLARLGFISVICAALWILFLWFTADQPIPPLSAKINPVKGQEERVDTVETAIRERPQIGSNPESVAAKGDVADLSEGGPVIVTEWLDSAQTVLTTGTRVFGKREGLWRAFLEDGSLWNEAYYKNGKLHGFLRTWNSHGAMISEAQYVDGQLQGVARAWHQNGQLAIEANYGEGKLQGRYVEWYANGLMKAETEYAQDRLDGRALFYRETGVLDLEKSGIYKNGARVSSL